VQEQEEEEEEDGSIIPRPAPKAFERQGSVGFGHVEAKAQERVCACAYVEIVCGMG
jgi:hypothetical protein